MKKYLKKLKERLQGIPSERSAPGKYFSAVYRNNYWKGQESLSGTGSEGVFAKQKIALIKEINNQYGISRLLDLGCGDFHWMQEIASQMEHYHGIDVVTSVIANNQKQYGSNNVTFQCLDLSAPTDQQRLESQQSELIICFDVIGHMLNEEIDSFLHFLLYEIKAKYFLITNRRDDKSELYLQRPKSRREGINIQKHALFQKHHLEPIWQRRAQYPGDYFELYALPHASNA